MQSAVTFADSTTPDEAPSLSAAAPTVIVTAAAAVTSAPAIVASQPTPVTSAAPLSPTSHKMPVLLPQSNGTDAQTLQQKVGRRSPPLHLPYPGVELPTSPLVRTLVKIATD